MILPRALGFLLLLAVLTGTFVRECLASGLAFVVNSGGASISVVDMQSRREVRRIPALREPHHLVLSPDGKSLLVGDTVGNELLFLDPQTGDVQRRSRCADPYQLGFSPDGKMLVVNGLARNQVDVYDAADMQLTHRFAVESMPSHMAFSPDSSMVYVTLQGTDRLAAIDLRRMTIAWTKPVGKTPAGVMWHHGTLLVADMGTDYLAEVDPIDGRVITHITTGRGAHNLFASPDGKVVWVNNRVSGTTVALDSATLRPLRTYPMPGGPDDMDFAADGSVWITLRWAEKVAVLDPLSGNYERIDVGRSPHGIFLNQSARAAAKVALTSPGKE
ncbi:MAG: beta-propeller fold lactonase family protein [Acetobacteraceae bacterium]|nr:beta-propeller fold lactonase family protein [Acetobacteraceae bacterium]